MTDAKIEKLKKLKDSGAITQKEFNEEKKKLTAKKEANDKNKDTAYDRLIRHRTINSNWLMALAPFIGALIGWILVGMVEGEDEIMGMGASFCIVFPTIVICSILFCIRDSGLLKEAGHEARLAAWFPPLHLIKRAKLLDEPNPAFWTWIVMLLLSLMSIFVE